MQTFVLSPQNADSTVQVLLNQAASGNLEIRDMDGNIVAYVLMPDAREALIYAEARLDLEQNRDATHEALQRRGGISTSQLLEKARAKANASSTS